MLHAPSFTHSRVKTFSFFITHNGITFKLSYLVIRLYLNISEQLNVILNGIKYVQEEGDGFKPASYYLAETQEGNKNEIQTSTAG